MNLFNKTEAAGIFISVAIMALALTLIRFKTDTFATADALPEAAQRATVVVSQEEQDAMDLERKLAESLTPAGDLVKLVVDDVRIGSGREVVRGDTVVTHYIGTTKEGIKFDSSYDRGEPYTFTTGEGKVIEGWETGILGMKAGGQRILVIPPDMAYGNRQVGVIPPDSVLVYMIELVDIR